MKYNVVIEPTDEHGSPEGTPRLQPVTGKGDGLDLAWFAADSLGGVHIWRFKDQNAANKFIATRRAAGVKLIGSR